MKIIKSTKNIEGKYHIKNLTGGNISIKAATNKNSSVRLQMKEELMDQILSEIKSKLKEIMTSYQFGYDDNEWEDYSGADIYLDNRGYIVITVYAEVSYNGLVKIMDALNPIVEKYDSDAYFDADTPGRCSAYIDPDNIPSNMYPYDDIQNSEKIYSSQSQYANRDVPDHMVYNSTDLEDVTAGDNPMSFRYKGRRIKLLTDGTGYAIYEKGEMIDYGFKSLEDAEAAIDEYDDIYQDDVQVYSATEEDEEDLPMVDQEYDSAATSINSNKLPAIYKMVNFNEGDVVVDFGGGKFDNAVEYIRDKGATLCVYDPYNRSAEHNREVLKILRENGGADAAVNSNVLNVIKEPEARKNVLENIARITKPGAPIYITVYEGKGNGQEGPTKSGYQLNRKTADYLEEIQEVFPDATRRGKLITAHNTGSVTSSTDVQSSSTILCSYDEFITWYDNLSDEEQWKVDDIADTNGIPFYEEASDDELSWLHDVATSEIHASADIVEGASNEVELDPEESVIDMNIDQYIIVDSERSWDYDSDNYDWASSDGEGSDWYSDNGVRLDDPTGVVEKIDELIEPHVPIEPGTYRVQGYIELYYTVSGVYENRYDYTEDDYSSDINSDFGSAEYNKKLSKIEDIKVTKI